MDPDCGRPHDQRGGRLHPDGLLAARLYLTAVWTHAAGIIVGVGLVMGGENEFGRNYAPFVLPL